MPALILRGLGSRLVVVRGLGASASLGGGMRFGGRAMLAEYAQVGGGFRLGGTGTSPRTFLAALVALLRSDMKLVGAVGAPRIYSTWPGTKVPLPFVLIEDYVEAQPGEVIEHNAITLTLSAYAASASTARAVGMAVQDAVDTPAMNKRSTRGPLFWVDGIELDTWREPTMPPVRLGKTDRGEDAYRWQVTYTFNILPRFQD